MGPPRTVRRSRGARGSATRSPERFASVHFGAGGFSGCGGCAAGRLLADLPAFETVARPGAVSSLAYRIASRASFAFLKQERRWRPIDDEEAADLLPASADRDALALLSDLSVLLNWVSPASRAVLLLHYIQGLSLDETAAVLGIGVGTVKSSLAWGLSRLRKRMEVER